jgi:hypothetical protein
VLSVSLIRVLGANEATPVSRTVTTQPLSDLIIHNIWIWISTKNHMRDTVVGVWVNLRSLVASCTAQSSMDFVPVDMGSAQEELHTVDVLVAAVRKRDAHDTLKYACAARAGAGGRDTQSHHTCRFFRCRAQVIVWPATLGG